jgi:hypothetical protein
MRLAKELTGTPRMRRRYCDGKVPQLVSAPEPHTSEPPCFRCREASIGIFHTSLLRLIFDQWFGTACIDFTTSIKLECEQFEDTLWIFTEEDV